MTQTKNGVRTVVERVVDILVAVGDKNNIFSRFSVGCHLKRVCAVNTAAIVTEER